MFFRRVRLTLCALATFGVLAVHPTWARSVGADVWNVPELQEQICATRSEGNRLDAENEDVRHRLVVKDAIVMDLIAGRITLAEATEQFVVLNASRPECVIAIRRTQPGTTDDEKTARNVIEYALPRVAPHQRGAVAGRLRAELDRALSARGTH